MWLIQMIKNIFSDQTIDIIRWENLSDDLLVWKWPKKLDEIKNNSSLIVDPWLAAIFVHNGKIEAIQKDSWKWSLETDNIPFLSTLKNFMSGFETHDKAAVYFVKINQITNQKWGTPNSITYIDPVYDFPVELRAFWNFSFQVIDIENFWKNYVANKETVLVDDIRMLIVDRLVWNIAATFAHKKVSYNEIDSKTIEIAKELEKVTKEEFEKLWLKLTDFRIEDINFTEKTESFIEKVTSKSAQVAAINKTKNIDSEAMENYSNLEKLDIAKEAAQNWWTAWDMMWAGIWMAMWMDMAKNMNTQNEKNNVSYESNINEKIRKLNDLFEKKLITQEEYQKKKEDILNSL